MATTEYWDESEFNFFNGLDDVDKLLYIYDLMIGEFVHEYNGEDVSLPIFEFEFEEEEKIRQDVLVSFTTDGDIKFEGGDLDVLEKVARDMVTNGLLLTNRKVSFIHETVILTYTLIGEGLPISMN